MSALKFDQIRTWKRLVVSQKLRLGSNSHVYRHYYTFRPYMLLFTLYVYILNQ